MRPTYVKQDISQPFHPPPPSADSTPATATEHVAAGLKGTINNPNVSDDAKQRASQRLEEAGPDMQNLQSSNQGSDPSEAHDNHVIGGYKATLKNPRVSDDAKDNAREKLNTFGASVE
ncbi:hypothetical protein D9619_004154 [Psilocybe cf. subviscida]|uniref:Conidiation-specific protein 6 n=1 Tax=Psilocybe cf. subviscida TaxID=2480587 RepID=A0A8H5F990_9AGAR|nr:hypothetical protein D9619_004154 [Psilocybe cf. subviscida]